MDLRALSNTFPPSTLTHDASITRTLDSLTRSLLSSHQLRQRVSLSEYQLVRSSANRFAMLLPDTLSLSLKTKTHLHLIHHASSTFISPRYTNLLARSLLFVLPQTPKLETGRKQHNRSNMATKQDNKIQKKKNKICPFFQTRKKRG